MLILLNVQRSSGLEWKFCYDYNNGSKGENALVDKSYTLPLLAGVGRLSRSMNFVFWDLWVYLGRIPTMMPFCLGHRKMIG